MTKRYLNLGCGTRFCPDWENVDFASTTPGVRAHNLLEGIPFPDTSFDLVYHSHILEHFPKKQALAFLRECHRVLMPGGVIRIAVPDLERIARFYLEALERALNEEPGWAEKYEWMVIEMYDQTVREFCGGEMLQFACNATPTQLTFIKARVGGELERMLSKSGDPVSWEAPSGRSSVRGKLLDYALRLLIGQKGLTDYDVGRFRSRGEVHKWMYDRYSLTKALKFAGFEEVEQVDANQSRVPNWTAFQLDTDPDGNIYKPDSLYMEATRR